MSGRKPLRLALVFTVAVILLLLLASCGLATEPNESKIDNGGTDQLVAANQESASPLANPTSQSTAHGVINDTGLIPTASLVPEASASNSESLFQELKIGNQGFYQTADQLFYAFEVRNPNDGAIIDSLFQINAYDSAGRLLATEIERIPLLLPQQLLGIAASLPLSVDEIVNRISLQITAGDAFSLAILPELEVAGIRYRPSEFYDRVSGLIKNTGDLDLQDIRISALVYDAANNIIGAGYSFLSFLPSQEATGIEIVLSTADPVDRIALFPRVSLASLMQTNANLQRSVSLPTVLDSGFSQDGIEVSYGFLLDNANSLFNVLGIEYRVTFLNELDGVIAVDEGYVDLLQPRQAIGFGDTLLLGEEEEVAQMSIISRVDHFQPAITSPGLSAETVAIITNTLGTVVTGNLVNPYQIQLDNVRLSALVFSGDGRIIGGGFDWIDSIPAEASIPVEIFVAAKEPVASATLFAALAEVIRR